MATIARVAAVAMAAMVVAVSAGCGDDGGGRDAATFCARFAELSGNSPFEDLLIATPEEMRDAFDTLRVSADRLADAAPDEAATAAGAYRDSIDTLIGDLEAAGFDNRNVDTLAYSRSVADYGDAAVTLDDAAQRVCATG